MAGSGNEVESNHRRYIGPKSKRSSELSIVKRKIPYLREVREDLLYSHLNGTLDDEEFALLYDINSSKNPDLPYWAYRPFNLDEMDDTECKTEFRFF